MSNNPKIKLISPSTKSGGIKFNSPDFQIDPNVQFLYIFRDKMIS
jgi:hypothetical protein